MAQATPDLSDFEKLSSPRKKVCVVGPAVEALGGDEGAQLQAALATDVGRITNSAITKWLKARNIDTTPQAIRSHRSHTCICFDE